MENRTNNTTGGPVAIRFIIALVASGAIEILCGASIIHYISSNRLQDGLLYSLIFIPMATALLLGGVITLLAGVSAHIKMHDDG